jgi:hypothetical protein
VQLWRAAVKRGSGRRQVRRGEGRDGQRGVGEGGGRAGKDKWTGAERRWGGAHGRPVRRQRRAQRNRGGGGEVDEGGLDCNFQKVQGPYCNAQITFKPELK